MKKEGKKGAQLTTKDSQRRVFAEEAKWPTPVSSM
jgi:hypothetical protein